MSLNVLHGISTIWVMDVTTENAYATAVLPAGIIVKKADNKFYLTDGTHTIQRISPIVDQVYTPAEKSIISAALSGGTYIPAPNGVVVHNNSGKIDDVSLGIINNGKLKEQYLSDFVEAGIIRYAKLPDNVKYSFYTVNTYNDLNSLNSEQRKKLIVVKDASSDPNNDVTGSGLYYYDNGWVSVLSISDKSITATDIANAGAVMYVLIDVFGLDKSSIVAPIDERRGRTLMYEIMRGGNFGQYSGLSEHGTVAKYLLKNWRSLQLIREYPAEALAEPLFRTYHFFWRRGNK